MKKGSNLFCKTIRSKSGNSHNDFVKPSVLAQAGKTYVRGKTGHTSAHFLLGHLNTSITDTTWVPPPRCIPASSLTQRSEIFIYQLLHKNSLLHGLTLMVQGTIFLALKSR